MERHGSRKKSGKQDDQALVQAAKEEVLPGYEEYLVLLQERNKLLKRLRKKNKNQVDMERKEQGFSIYVNGPHKTVSPTKATTQGRTDSGSARRPPKTAGDQPRNPIILDKRALDMITQEELERQREKNRARTAPSARERRRNWNMESVEIKTAGGDKRRVKAPELLTGRYADDFEDEEEDSDELRSSGSENSLEQVPVVKRRPVVRASDDFRSSDSCNSMEEMGGLSDESGEDMEIDAAAFDKRSPPRKKMVTKTRSGSSLSNASDEEVINEKLMLSMSELKKLRQSLVRNEALRQSMAREVSSDEESFVPESPIPEVEEDLVPALDSTYLEDVPRANFQMKKHYKPNDTIVLEFGGAQDNRKERMEKNLSAARRKDVDPDDQGYRRRPESAGSQGRPSKRVLTHTKSDNNVLTSDNPKKTARPLSANRRMPETASQDSDAEASAVLAALRAENEQASKFNKEDKQPMARKGTPKSLSRESLPKPVYDKGEPAPKAHQMRGSVEDSRQSGRERPLVAPNKIEQIMEKVMKMTPKHQRRLVKMLGKLDNSAVLDSLESPEEKPAVRQSQARRPVRASRETVVKKKSTHSEEEGVIELNVELVSNWGHAMRLGLTEIQLFDTNNCLIPVKASDVMIHGAEDVKGTPDLLFNGKCKTNKERNMWTCRYRARRPIEISILARNPHPESKENFTLSHIKVWNFNKSITELDIGVKQMRIFLGGDLVFSGEVEKGCGNQVFDYNHTIQVLKKPEPESPPGSPELHTNNSAYVEPHPRSTKQKVEMKNQREVTSKPVRNGIFSANISSGSAERLSSPAAAGRPPMSPRGERSPSPSPKPRNGAFSPRGENSEKTKLNRHRSISPSPREQVRIIRSISRSPPSSASDGGETVSHQSEKSIPRSPRSVENRSETRTLTHRSDRQLRHPSVGSDSETDEGQRDQPSHKMPGKRRGIKTPKKSKRMAARLDGHSSTEVDTSKSVTDSAEHRPPLPKPRKSQEKPASRPLPSKPQEEWSKKEPTTSAQEPARKAPSQEAAHNPDGVASSQASTISQSEDDTPMLQKLKEMNKKEQTAVRKKEIPRWLKGEDQSGPFESPLESMEASGAESSQRAPQAAPSPVPVPAAPPTQEEINMLIDEEMSAFPKRRTDQQGPEQKPSQSPDPNAGRDDGQTPMQRIQKNRSKWRENPSFNLEESWGSLTQFNKSQRGRLSLDMDDDVMDEYINASKKQVAPQPSIQEEEAENIDELLQEEMESSDDDGFVIPELPYGRELLLDIKSTWGDKHYVGLTGIEVFTSTGEPATVARVKADPSDINILPEYEKDPRVANNLVDGMNRTRDDVHMWLAPFTKGKAHTVTLVFDKPCKIALIRIWNYNKSRIHSYRGVKDVVITLDSAVIFKGEIARACGGIEGGTEAFGDTILFTVDEAMLEAVSKYDEAFEGEMLSDDEPYDVERPSTADDGSEDRPLTRAVGNIKKAERKRSPQEKTKAEASMATYEGDILVYKGRRLELNFMATWGDHHYLGLTGIEVVGKDGEALPVDMKMLTAEPQDLRSLPGNEQDDRTLDKVIDGTNVTVSDEHMWLVPFTEGQDHTLEIDFGEKVVMAGLRIWNYNKSKEDTYRGARIMYVSIDGRGISPPEGFLVRKGPGNCHFDYAQEISFCTDGNSNSASAGQAPGVSSSLGDASQNYEVVQMPNGFIYQFQLFTTWGDTYYVGLNGIEFYDAAFKKIELTQTNISAYPDSVNVLANVQNDVRTPDKLIDGRNDTMDSSHMWLAPILPAVLNRVYVIFDQPTAVSMIKVWSYSKNPTRGAKDFALLVDDLLVYNGELQSVSQGARGILPTCEGPQPYHTILFTNNKDVLKKEKNTIINNQTGEQDVQMTNDKQVVSHYNDPKKAKSGKPIDQNLRPTTSVIGHSKKKRR